MAATMAAVNAEEGKRPSRGLPQIHKLPNPEDYWIGHPFDILWEHFPTPDGSPPLGIASRVEDGEGRGIALRI